MPVFAATAVARLHELAQGIPSRVRQLADLALVAGAATSAAEISESIVESASRELDLADRGAAPRLSAVG
jgi:type II secretory pathway predicted ATPase ExeA